MGERRPPENADKVGQLLLSQSALFALPGQVHSPGAYMDSYFRSSQKIRNRVTDGCCYAFSYRGNVHRVPRKKSEKPKREPRWTPTIVGVNLRRLREAKGLQQGELAAAMGLKQGAVSRVEIGQTQYPRSDFLHAAAKALGVPIDAFWRPVDDVDSDIADAIRSLRDSKMIGEIDPIVMAKLRAMRAPLRNPTPNAILKLIEALRLDEDAP